MTQKPDGNEDIVLAHNEFIVYDTRQVRMKYLIHFEQDFN